MKGNINVPLSQCSVYVYEHIILYKLYNLSIHRSQHWLDINSLHNWLIGHYFVDHVFSRELFEMSKGGRMYKQYHVLRKTRNIKHLTITAVKWGGGGGGGVAVAGFESSVQ